MGIVSLRAVRLCLAGMLLCLPVASSAQTNDAPADASSVPSTDAAIPAPAPTTESAPASASAPDSAPAADAAWDAAAELLRLRDFGAAQTAFAQFASTYATDARARYARSISDALRSMNVVPDREVAATSQLGRIEVAIFSTLWGLGTGAIVGFEVADLINSNDGKLPLWTAIGAGGLGLGLSLFLTGEYPPTDGQASLISSAGVWGYALGAETVFGLNLGEECERDYDVVWCTSPNPHIARMLPVAFSSAAIAGAIVYGRRNPEITTGDVALLNAAALWSTVTALEVSMLTDFDTANAPLDFMLVGTGVGLGAGVLLANRFAVSRSRIGLINLSGVLGVGLGAAIGATAELDSSAAFGGLMLGGQAVGLTLGTVLTRQRAPRERTNADISLLPMTVRDGDHSWRGVSFNARW